MTEGADRIYTKEDFIVYGNRLHYNTVIDITVNFSAAYIVFKYSTKAMGYYKYYILLTILCAFLMDFHISFIFGPFLMLPSPLLCGAGFISRHFGFFWGAYFQFGILHIVTSGVGCSLIYSLFYQYSSLNGNLKFFHSIKGGIIIFLSIVFYPIPAFAIFVSAFDYDATNAYIEKNYSNSYFLYSTTPSCYGLILDLKAKIYLGFLAFSIFNVYVIMTIFALKIHQKLSAMKNLLSPATLKARRQLLLALCFQMTIPFALIVFPLILILICIIIGAKQINVVSDYAMPVVALHSLANASSIIFAITPYRRALFNGFKKVFRIKEKQTQTFMENNTVSFAINSSNFKGRNLRCP